MKDNRNVIPVYLGIKDVAELSGMSVYYLRNGVANGTIACVKSGKKILINYPLLLANLEEEARKRLVH